MQDNNIARVTRLRFVLRHVDQGKSSVTFAPVYFQVLFHSVMMSISFSMAREHIICKTSWKKRTSRFCKKRYARLSLGPNQCCLTEWWNSFIPTKSPMKTKMGSCLCIRKPFFVQSSDKLRNASIPIFQFMQDGVVGVPKRCQTWHGMGASARPRCQVFHESP